MGVAGQTVVLTGAAQGLGAAIARAFAAEGARLVLIDRDADGLAALKAELGSEITAILADLSDGKATAQALCALPATVDTLIHNAAILEPRPLEAETLESFRATLDVGIQAAFQLAQAVWQGMRSAGGGALVFVSSRSGIEGFVDESAYCAAKHALEGFSKCLAMEGAAHGIISATITPGHPMQTPMSERNYPPELKATWIAPDRLAPAFLHIAATRDPALSGRRLDAWALSQEVN
ncbi:MAG: SDR family oxidoreductase [Pseudomonadota bacterium]